MNLWAEIIHSIIIPLPAFEATNQGLPERSFQSMLDQARFMEPIQIGNYRILRQIGEGGMASVYEAEHAILGRRAAIKVLNPVLSANEAIRERFRNEARVMASLEHPNITRVLEFDEQPQCLSIVMELLEGDDLNRRIRANGPLDENELKSVFRQVLSALQYAHDKGVVHRDIKPSNIYLLPNGQVKILDFGIAKVYGQGNELTMTGQQMGTPAYMSPEQVRAEKSIDHRTDIYSLGVTMYFAAAGKPPYDAATESQFDILSKIVYEPIPDMAGGGMAHQMVQKACAKDRVKRFQHCREWLDTMEGTESVTFRGDLILISTEIAQLEQTRIVTSPKPRIKRLKHVQGAFSEVRIGDQVWMAENLNIGRFRNGDPIPMARTAMEWVGAGPACCYYENKRSNGSVYGRLYNWYAVNDSRGLAPEGWHVPSDEEWIKLTDGLGGEKTSGLKMKSINGWDTRAEISSNGTNESAYDARPGGYRDCLGTLNYLGSVGYWWSASATSLGAWNRVLHNKGIKIFRGNNSLCFGLSVRCVRD